MTKKTETTSLEDVLARYNEPSCSVVFVGVERGIPVPDLLCLLQAVYAGGMVIEVSQCDSGLRLFDPGRKQTIGWVKRNLWR